MSHHHHHHHDGEACTASSTPSAIPTTMRAVAWLSASSSPFRYVENFRVPTFDHSGVHKRHVLLRVSHCGLNPVDWKLGQSNWLKLSLPGVVGFDVSGIVKSIGDDVKEVTVGEVVFGSIELTAANGGLAEFAICRADRIVPLPSSVPPSIGASIGVAFLSVFDGFRQVKDSLSSSSIVYVAAASGGVGHFAVQLFKTVGAKVIAAASSAEGKAILKEQLGADMVVDYKSSTFKKEIEDFVGGGGIDVIYDPSYSQSSFQQSIPFLKEGGSWIVLGSAFAAADKDEAKAVAAKKGKVLIADLVPYSADLEKFGSVLLPGLKMAAELLDKQKLMPWINKVIPLDEVIHQLAILKMGKGGFGKTIVRIE